MPTRSRVRHNAADQELGQEAKTIARNPPRLLTGLSVSEDAGVVTLERIVQDVATQGIEDDLLAREVLQPRLQGVKAVIEREGLRLVPATVT